MPGRLCTTLPSTSLRRSPASVLHRLAEGAGGARRARLGAGGARRGAGRRLAMRWMGERPTGGGRLLAGDAGSDILAGTDLKSINIISKGTENFETTKGRLILKLKSVKNKMRFHLGNLVDEVPPHQ